MTKIHQTILINAPRQKVWDIMLGDATYREWTKSFMEGSYYKGSWEQGSKILFLAPNKDGSGDSGMVSRIAENRPYEFVSIEHLGIVTNGVEDTTSEKVKDWVGIHENYTFTDKDGGTEVALDMDIIESEKEYMEKAWTEGLIKLKELVERQ